MNGWEDEEMQNRFTRESFDTIVMLLNMDDIDSQLIAIETLSETLSYANEDLLQNFPINDLSRGMVKLLNSELDFVQEQAALCIFTFLEAHTGSTRALCSNGLLETMKSIFQRPSFDIQPAIYCIRALEVISQYRPSDLGRQLGLDPCFRFINQFTIIDKRSSMKTVANITKAFVINDFSKYLIQITPHLNASDQRLQSSAIYSFCSIVQKSCLNNVPVDIIPQVLPIINILTDQCLRSIYLNSIQILSRQPNFVVPLINSNFDFLSINHRTALSIVLNLLPPAMLPNIRENRPVLPESIEYAKRIQKDILLKCTFDDDNADIVIILSVIAKEVPDFEIPIQVLQRIAGLTLNPKFTSASMLLAINYAKREDVQKSGLISILNNTVPPQEISNWYSEKLQMLGSIKMRKIPSFDTFADLADYLVKNEFSGIELFNCSDFPDNCLKLIEKTSDFSSIDIPKFRNLIHDVLGFLPLPKSTPYGFSIESILSHSIPVKVLYDEEEHNIAFNINSTLISIENWMNEEILDNHNEDLAESFESSPLSQYILFDGSDDFTQTTSAVFQRLFDSVDQKISLEYRGKKLNLNDPILSIYDHRIRENEEPIIIKENDDQPDELTAFSVPLEIDDTLKKYLDILKALSNLEGNTQCEPFEKRMVAFFNKPIDIILCNNIAVQIPYHYPFLFSKEYKIKLFKATSLQTIPALEVFGKVPNRKEKIKIQVSRDNLFNDGMELIKTVMKTPLFIDASFKGEQGIGPGPTSEFFALLGEEFSKSSRGMWLNEKRGEYCWSAQGLYPSPAADPSLFEAFGILCGKALNNGCLIPLPFNPAFFKLVKNEKVKIEEVSSYLENSLAIPDGLIGLTFLYPGIEIPLCEGGEVKEVDNENLTEFVSLVKEFTVGEPVRKLARAFYKGFSMVVKPGMVEVLSGDDFCQMLGGEFESQLTKQEIMENIDISHGYSKDSPQIQMFIDILLQFNDDERRKFFKFLTGCERLPIGGLKALEPKLTIACRFNDEGTDPNSALPTVMTCMNYFKLPAYSSKDIMEQKIKLAISEGQCHFSLS